MVKYLEMDEIYEESMDDVNHSEVTNKPKGGNTGSKTKKEDKAFENPRISLPYSVFKPLAFCHLRPNDFDW